uniref:hypothetical protein n=1 Tax=Petrachloros mirabilis TaxID=2918835 RepID=UPI001EE8158C|nr:hypothetical protein [Petrachloros mirabilis]
MSRQIYGKTAPWVGIACLGLAYGLLGWHLSAYHILWSAGAWGLGIFVIYTLLWSGRIWGRMLQMGPRSVVTMLVLSAVITMAVAASAVFVMLALLLAAKLLARLELQVAGYNRWATLIILVLISFCGLSSGWVIGYLYFPSSPYWLGQEGWRAITHFGAYWSSGLDLELAPQV